MPMVLVIRNPKKVKDSTLTGPTGFLARLARNIAENLHIDEITEAHLKPEDIEVICQDRGKLDICRHDIQIIVFASHFKEREVDLSRRIGLISSFIQGWFDRYNVSGYVWFRLAPAAFNEWVGS